MKQWGNFEDKCLEYLKRNYGSTKTYFKAIGKSDSTKPDIEVYVNSNNVFNIEAKMANAQCGQFVLFPSETTPNFVYSEGNAYPLNTDSQAIINKMNNYFDEFKTAGSRGKRIIMDENVFYSWVINYYKSKKVKYFITEVNDGMIIFPIDRFNEYFDISAVYRMKKSGSSSPTKGYFEEIKKILNDNNAMIEEENEKVFISTTLDLNNKKLCGEKYTYLFRHAKDGKYLVRKLSNTCNSNVIFSIKLKNEQDPLDLAQFVASIE